MFLRKYHGGTLAWEQKAESSVLWDFQGSSPAVSAGTNGIIYVAGGYQHWARFGPSTLSGHGSSNMFVAELGPCEVIATGGLAEPIIPHSRTVQHYEPWLTLYGLRIIFERNV